MNLLPKALAVLTLAGAAVFGRAQLPGQATQSRPNILVAIPGDAGWLHLSAYGCRFVKTPAFDRVATGGVLFRNCFTTNPKCSPSRATLRTGRNTWQLEEACDHFRIFPSKFGVYPDLLEAAGYYVGYPGNMARSWQAVMGKQTKPNDLP